MRSATKVRLLTLTKVLGVPLALLIVALLTVFDGLRIVVGGDQASGVFVLVIGSCLAVFTILSTPFGSLSHANEQSEQADEEPVAASEFDGEEQPATYTKQVLTAIALMVGWAIVLPWLGFAISNGIFLVAFMILVGRRNILSSLLIGAAVGAATSVGFSALGVVLPQGIFGI